MSGVTRRGALLGGALLAAPRLGSAQARRPLRFIPQSDLGVLDPIWTAAYVTRNHGLMVFDTLYGMDDDYRMSPQMLEGHRIERDGREWLLTLREGLRFHDGEPVRAQDCVASIRRWGARDGFGQSLLAATEELAAPDDRSIRFRLKHPFPLLPDALGKAGSNICAIMPERLANTDPFRQVTEMIGSGPFRFKADERVPGSRVVYERNPHYVPRGEGTATFTAGPKHAHVERVEWHVLPDPATAAAAMQSGEMDWWENPTFDLLPLLRRGGRIAVAVQERTGYMGTLRFNHLNPPFSNAALRRAVLGAVQQEDFMTAVAGSERGGWNAPVGFFCPGTPMASAAGMEALTSPRDLDKVRREVAASGYAGERVVVLLPTDFPTLKALGEVGADMLKRIGLAVEVQAMDWGTTIQRLAKTEPVEQGGWSVFHTYWSGLDQLTPAVHASLRATGRAASRGWPTSERLEALRDQWLAATELPDQQRIAAEIQRQAFIDVPYVPLGQMMAPTAYRRELSGVLNGFALFWNLRRG